MSTPLDAACDWLESVALARGFQAVGVQYAQALALGHFGLDEDLVANCFTKASHRKKALGDLYPFEVQTDFIVPRPEALSTVYSQALLVSATAPFRQLKSWDQNTASKAFEFNVEYAVGIFFGSQTRSVNFGFPSTIGRPKDFPSAIEWLSELMRIRIGSAYRPPRKKDGGVDVVVWKDLDDPHGGLPLMLVQTTIMQDFLNKIADVDLRLWSGWLATDTNPLVCLAVPTCVTDKNIWSEISARGTLLDRIRLCKLAPDAHLQTQEYFEELVQDLRGQIE